jgi:magnesium chelatase family protein
MFEKVLIAFEKQMKRGYFNSMLPEGWEFELTEDAERMLDMAIERFSISKRGKGKILRVAQTIADLENCDKIDKKAVLEAVSYRRR